MKNVHVQIKEDELDVSDCYGFINDQAFGGNVLFVGSIRDHSAGKDVDFLEFEAYIPMAIKELEKIAVKILSDYPNAKVFCEHRVGKLALKDIAVIIGISTKHRSEAFKACEFFIDELKKTVPIWKKEFWTDGSHWVNSRP